MEKFGGICGQSYTLISKCYNKNTTVSATGSSGHAGGIVGNAYSSEIRNCYNTGAVTAYLHAGGIVGDGTVNNGDAYYRFVVTGCYNKGVIESTSTAAGSRAGGICGYGVGTSSWDGEIAYCYNWQLVKCGGTTSAGGIIGYASYMTVSNCMNDWSVSLSNATTNAYAGAIIGYWNGSNNSMSNVTWRSDKMSYAVGYPKAKREDYGSYGTKVTTKATTSEVLSIVNGYSNAYVADTKNINGGYPILAWQVK